MMAKKQKVKAEHIILDRGEVQGQAQGRIIMADSMVAPTGKYLTNQQSQQISRYVSLFRSELAENEIIPSDIAKDVKDILSNDSDQSDTDMGRAEYDYYQIGWLTVIKEILSIIFRARCNARSISNRFKSCHHEKIRYSIIRRRTNGTYNL